MFDGLRPMMLKYAIHHNFVDKLTELMSKCFLENAQDPFRLMADTIYEGRGINYPLKIETLEQNIMTLEENIKTLEKKITTLEKCKGLRRVKAEDSEQDSMKSAYESFGKSMFNLEDTRSFTGTGSDSVMIEQAPINESNTNVIELHVSEAMILDQTLANNVNDESDNPLFISEESLDSTTKLLDQSNVSLEETLHTSPSLIISDEKLDLPIIVHDAPEVTQAVISNDELEALIDSISDKSNRTNDADKTKMCSDINNLLLDTETIEIENALKAMHSSVSVDYDYDTTMIEPTVTVSQKISDKTSTVTSDQSLADDDDFEPDYEGSD